MNISISKHLKVHIGQVFDRESLKEDIENLTIQGHGLKLTVMRLTYTEL